MDILTELLSFFCKVVVRWFRTFRHDAVSVFQLLSAFWREVMPLFSRIKQSQEN